MTTNITELVAQMREAVQKLRRTPLPIATVAPMLTQAADALEAAQAEVATLAAAGRITTDICAERDAALADVGRLTQDRDEWKDSTIAANENQRRADKKASDMQDQRDAALARLAELPDTCDGKEQEAFEAHAVGEKLNMQRHPLHYLFLNGETYAARQAWKAAILYCRKQVDAAAGASPQPSHPDEFSCPLCFDKGPQPGQAGELSDAEALNFMEHDRGEHVLSIGTGWYSRSSYGKPLKRFDDLRCAIIAAINAKGAP